MITLSHPALAHAASAVFLCQFQLVISRILLCLLVLPSFDPCPSVSSRLSPRVVILSITRNRILALTLTLTAHFVISGSLRLGLLVSLFLAFSEAAG